MSRVFGTPRQNGYVVRDLDAAIAHWVEVLGVGPFFYVDRLPLRDFRYQGEASDPHVSVALAQCGPIQIELISQRNDAPSMFHDFLTAGREGLQHVAFWTERFDADMARYRARGLRIGHSGRSGSGGPDERFAYLLTEYHPGTVVEISEVSGPKKDLYRMVAEAARDWDGDDPVRLLHGRFSDPTGTGGGTP